MKRINVALITDSFPPVVDGVSRCVVNYAHTLTAEKYGDCVVITQRTPGEMYYHYPFPVLGFPSMGLPRLDYRAGYPIVPFLINSLKKMDIDLIHAHSPFTSMVIARQIRRKLRTPIVFTQHTKWEYDIKRTVRTGPLRRAVEALVYDNIEAADDVWTVSRGTALHMRNRGFSGDYIVMENGTDFPQGEADAALTREVCRTHGLSGNRPVLLFVGRMYWYKNIRLILDALTLLRARGLEFDMLMVGDGTDLPDMRALTAAKSLNDCVHFTGKISDREKLRAIYTLSTLLVFPSVYDNAPLVIREAAACRCPALVIRGSSSSEILEEGQTGFCTEETPEDVADAVAGALSNPEWLARVANGAAEHVYLPWPKVVARAAERYHEVLERCRSQQA
ncbi:MAG: glycosyltransferase [Oscillospiraceae bacterium]|nr:glycosyltransferase [Oscillospiraceae bacterium]